MPETAAKKSLSHALRASVGRPIDGLERRCVKGGMACRPSEPFGRACAVMRGKVESDLRSASSALLAFRTDGIGAATDMARSPYADHRSVIAGVMFTQHILRDTVRAWCLSVFYFACRTIDLTGSARRAAMGGNHPALPMLCRHNPSENAISTGNGSFTETDEY